MSLSELAKFFLGKIKKAGLPNPMETDLSSISDERFRQIEKILNELAKEKDDFLEIVEEMIESQPESQRERNRLLRSLSSNTKIASFELRAFFRKKRELKNNNFLSKF